MHSYEILPTWYGSQEWQALFPSTRDALSTKCYTPHEIKISMKRQLTEISFSLHKLFHVSWWFVWNWEIWSNISAVQKANLRRLSLGRFTKTTCVASVGTHQPSKCRYANEYPMMLRLLALLGWHMVLTQWASCQIRRMVSYACASNAGNVFPATDFKLNRQ